MHRTSFIIWCHFGISSILQIPRLYQAKCVRSLYQSWMLLYQIQYLLFFVVEMNNIPKSVCVCIRLMSFGIRNGQLCTFVPFRIRTSVCTCWYTHPLYVYYTQHLVFLLKKSIKKYFWLENFKERCSYDSMIIKCFWFHQIYTFRMWFRHWSNLWLLILRFFNKKKIYKLFSILLVCDTYTNGSTI